MNQYYFMYDVKANTDKNKIDSKNRLKKSFISEGIKKMI